MFIGFSFNKNNLFSKLIAWFTKSQWSHCFIVYEKIKDDYLIIEASFHGGVKFNLLSKYQTKDFNLQLIPITELDIACLLPLIGNNYGSLQILGNLIARVFKLKCNPFKKDQVCSELVYIALINNGFSELMKGLKPNLVTPQDLYIKLNNIK